MNVYHAVQQERRCHFSLSAEKKNCKHFIVTIQAPVSRVHEGSLHPPTNIDCLLWSTHSMEAAPALTLERSELLGMSSWIPWCLKV